MATITIKGLSAFTSFGVGNAFREVKKTTDSLIKEVGSLTQKINTASTVTNLDTSKNNTQKIKTREETKKSSLTVAYDKLEQLVSDVDDIDEKVASKIEERKDDFYKKYSYLKPESEKSLLEKAKDFGKKLWDGICDIGKAIVDFVIDVGKWCKEHWKELLIGVIFIAIGALITVFTAGTGTAFWAAFGAAFLKGLGSAAIAMLIGGVTSGVTTYLQFKNAGFSHTVAMKNAKRAFGDGAANGFMIGGIFSSIGCAGKLLGNFANCEKWGSTIAGIFKTSTALSISMAAFDLIALADLAINPESNIIYDFNSKLHSNNLYNFAQISLSAISVFTGGMLKTMTCFVAGTMILTSTGLVAIEKIKAGDIVISTNPDTMEIAEKRVVETYIREDSKLIHIVVNGEEIVTTETHPFYVNNRGFVEAGELRVGDELVDVNNNIHLIEGYSIEVSEEPTTVYNFQVEDFHTYHVGNLGIFVHNADCTIKFKNKSGYDEEEYKQQLSDQQDALNKMTVDEYQRNRELYKKNGRATDSSNYQQAAREEAIAGRIEDNIVNKNMTYEQAVAEANNWAKGKAALHTPDQIAGGKSSNISGLGDSNINSSIGSQWKAKSRIGILDEYVANLADMLTDAEKKTTFLDVELVLE